MSLIKAIKPGDVFGEWVTISFVGYRGNWHKVWVCRCKCGVTREVFAQSLVNGNSRSCGCETGRKNGERQRRHGMASTRMYKAWAGMIDRCRNQNNTHYDRYGGRGITVCDEWNDFAVFLKDMGKRPTGMTIERVDNDGNYEPRNCVWATRKQQQNNRCANRIITHDGMSMTLMQWAETIGIAYSTLSNRLQRGWSEEKTLATPLLSQGRKQ